MRWIAAAAGVLLSGTLAAQPDPRLEFSTFFGGEASEQANGVALDRDGNVYVVGQAPHLTASPGAVSIPGGSSDDVFVLKLDPSDSRIVYLAVFGGAARERGASIAVDASGAAYVSGWTFSEDFPATPGAAQVRFGGGGRDAFVAKLSPNGSRLEYATYLGGAAFEDGNAIAVDADGAAYIAGATGSTNFPTTARAFQRTPPAGTQRSAFVAKLSPDGARWEYSTLLSGGERDEALALAVSAGEASIAGYTTSAALPATAGAVQRQLRGPDDAFVARLSADGSRLAAATYLGGAACSPNIGAVPCDQALAIRADAERVWVGGSTLSADFPLAGRPLRSRFGGGSAFGDGFLSVLSRDLARLEWSSYLGGGHEDRVTAIFVDAAGDLYATGVTGSDDFPLRPVPNALPLGGRGSGEVFLARIDPASGRLLDSLLLGGIEGETANAIAGDGEGAIVIAGETGSAAFPVTPGALQTTLSRVRNEGGDAFVSKFRFAPLPRFEAAGVVNAASFLPGALAPGVLVAIFGRGLGPADAPPPTLDPAGRAPVQLGGVRLLVNGAPAPMLFVSPNQINAAIPYAAAQSPLVSLRIERDGVSSDALPLRAASTMPGLFALPHRRNPRQAAALNQDLSVNGPDNPVERGSVVMLFVTGLGELRPAPRDGEIAGAELARPVAPVGVTIGGLPADVLYAGSAPGLVAGVGQINALVPGGVTTGPMVPVVFTAGPLRSQPDVAIAVK